MLHRIGVVFALVVVGLHAPSAVAQFKGGNVSASKYGWVSSLQEGKTLARTNGKPMMVVIRCVP